MKNLQGALEHLKTHQSYPATKADLVKECNSLSDFSEEDKREFEKSLPERTYNSSDEVIQALNWQTQAM